MIVEIIPARHNPKTEGRYLCFVSHDVKAEIAKPIVLLWWKGGWHFDESNVRFPRPPHAYAGPLPTGKLTDLFGLLPSHNYSRDGDGDWISRGVSQEAPATEQTPLAKALETIMKPGFGETQEYDL